MTHAAVVSGRFLLGWLFVFAGLRHLTILDRLSEVMKARGVPFARGLLLFGTVFQIAAGACVMFGLYVTASAIGLAMFTIAASVIVFNFWQQKDAARTESIDAWQRNLALVGGLLLAAASESGHS